MYFFFQAEDGIRDIGVTGVQTCALPIYGRKCFITNAPIADFAIISAMTDRTKGVKGISVFIVDANTEGWSVGAHENKMGIRGTITSDIVLDNVKVPKENLLDVEGKGFKIIDRKSV